MLPFVEMGMLYVPLVKEIYFTTGHICFQVA